MREYGLYINYEWCTGCHACEFACKQERELEPDQWGIRVVEVSYDKNGKKVIEYHPILTEYCNFCAERVQAGRKPACVHHCQAFCMGFDELEKLSQPMRQNGKGVVWGYPHKVEINRSQA